MQNLSRIVSEARQKKVSNEGILNLVREYLQILILKAIYQSKYSDSLSFMGGTCLRICHNLKRYSEDLDFALDKRITGYSFQELNGIIASFLKNTDFEVEVSLSEEKTVQKSFIRVAKILHLFGISPLKSQKIHVKLEVDTNPVEIPAAAIETFFVTKFNELFPILKHSDDTLFAGKLCAVFNREYVKGRDYYDLLWYLNCKEKINIDYMNQAMKQAGIKMEFANEEDIFKKLKLKISEVKIDEIMKDMGRFLEDPAEEVVLRNYKLIFDQAVAGYPRRLL